MKVIEKDILLFQERDFSVPIRDKTDYAKIIVVAAKIFLIDYLPDVSKCNSKIRLVIDKMSRLFFYKNEKFYSISFPFNVETEENVVKKITSYSGRKLDNQSISALISILDNPEFQLNPSPIDFYSQSNDIDEDSFSLLEEIFRFEPAYIRYDNDLDNENGKKHPQHHLDFNYSSYGTFKFGLKIVPDENYFQNLMDINTDCSFLDD